MSRPARGRPDRREDALESFALSPDGQHARASCSTARPRAASSCATRPSLALRWAPKLPIGELLGAPQWRRGTEVAFTLLVVCTFGDVYSVDATTGRREPLDHERDRPLQSRVAPGAGDRQVEELRRPGDLGRALPAAGALHRSAPRDHQHPRRARPARRRASVRATRGGAHYFLNELGVAIICIRTCAAATASARRSGAWTTGPRARTR